MGIPAAPELFVREREVMMRGHPKNLSPESKFITIVLWNLRPSSICSIYQSIRSHS
jgi:hypothetical protein